jgi:predicted HicB family RNase H-like nuclease
VSRPRKPGPGRQKPAPLKKGPRKSLPEELAHDAVAHEKAAPGDRVEMTFRVRLRRPVAEALTAWAVREETNLAALVAEILEAAVTKGKQPR